MSLRAITNSSPKSEAPGKSEVDIEQTADDTSYLDNRIVQSLSWSDVTVVVPDRETKLPKQILSQVSGHVNAGEMMAIMGPSGCGKTTLLNVLAQREASAKAQVSSTLLLNGQVPPASVFRRLSSYVECDDALIGSLSVKETLLFAARLSLSASLTVAERLRRVDKLLQAFGLTNQANTLVGTLLKKGISTGQKRRLSVASQLIAAPKVLFLDEPTSGLDSMASFKVMSYVKEITRMNNLIVIASIHQPSAMTFELFDKLLLLSGGKTCFSGPPHGVKPHFDTIGFAMPPQSNPAEFVLTLTNVDFESDADEAYSKIALIQGAWPTSVAAQNERTSQVDGSSDAKGVVSYDDAESQGRTALTTLTVLLHRTWIKSHRDVLVYGVRFAMYLGLAVMMGTVWLRLPATESSMQPFANCILFGSCFMSFMAVVYVPAFLEDRAVYTKDRSNGLYGSTPFIISNFLIGLPYLFIIAFVSSAFVYWMTNFRPDVTAFLIWVMWMYLNLVAAESLVVLMSSLFPNFVLALALTAFANGLWMSCNGFMVQLPNLNPFYRYVVYYIDYQAYVFRGLIVNEFGYRTYSCGDGCRCMYESALQDQCIDDGTGFLKIYGYDLDAQAKSVGIVLAIILVLRLMGWAALQWRK